MRGANAYVEKDACSNESLVRRSKDDDLWREKTDSSIKAIEERIEVLGENFISSENIKEIVIYKNEKFEADEAYADIFSQAKKTIYVIDDYVNIKTLSLLKHKKRGVDVILFTENKGSGYGKLSKEEIDDFFKFRTADLFVADKTRGKCFQ